MALTDVRKMSPEEKEAYHQEAESRIKVIKVQKPPENTRGEPRDVVVQVKTDLIAVLTQWVREGGEDNLHYHTNGDTFWMVLKGKARYWTVGEDKKVGDKMIAELGPREGVVIPGGSRYWFEKVGDEELELLQMVGYDKGGRVKERINVAPHKAWMSEPGLHVYE